MIGHRLPHKPTLGWLEPVFKQVVWFAFWIMFGLLVYNQAFPYPGFFMFAVAALAAPFREGPGYHVLNTKLKNWIMRGSNDGQVYVTDFKDTVYLTDHPKRKQAAFQGVSLFSVPVRDGNGISQLSLLHEAKTNVDTCFTSGEGWGAAAISEGIERYMLDGSFAGALKRVVNGSKVPMVATLNFMVRPADDSQTVQYLGQRWEKRVKTVDKMPPEQVNPVDKRIHDLTIKRAEEIYEQCSQVTMAIAISMERAKSWNKKLSELPIEVIARAPIIEATRSLAEDLSRMGVQGPKRFSLFQLNAFIKAVFSVDLQQFYADLARDIELERKHQFKSLADVPTLKRSPFPAQTYAHNDGLECDTTIHRYFWISSHDATEVPPGFWEELYNLHGINYMLSFYFETVPASREMRRVGFKRRLIKRKHEALSTDVSNPKYDNEDDEALQHHESVFSSHSAGIRSRLMITLSASSFEDCAATVDMVSAVCRGLFMTMEEYLGEANQVRAAFASIAVVLPD